MNIGETIRAERERQGLTQVDLAEATGLAERTISAIECGRSANHSVLQKISDILDLELRIKPRS